MIRAVATVLMLLVAATSLSAQAPSDKERTRIQQLVKELGSDKFRVREAAHRELIELAPKAREQLAKAAEGADPERAYRAKSILGQLPDPTHLIVDALKQPIPYAMVVVRVRAVNAKPDQPPQTTRAAFADRLGRVAAPQFNPAAGAALSLEARHPDYGIARCTQARPSATGGLPVCRMPLVRRQSPLRERAVEGQVVDGRGRPVAGATVDCNHVRTPGEGLINGEHPLGAAVTDRDGRFSLYFPAAPPRGREHGETIPPGSRYSLRVSSSRDDCFPVEDMVSNRKSALIQLPLAEHFHQFQFENPDGGVLTAADSLRNVWVTLRRPSGQVRLQPAEVIHGRRLVAGSYQAVHHTSQGRTVNYLPIKVDGDSPRVLQFRLPATVVYKGRVVEGITGKPISRAWVAGWRSSNRNNLALVTAEEWATLKAMPDVAPPDSKAFQLMKKYWGVEGLVRADEDGRFSIARPPDKEFYAIMAFAENTIPLQARTYKLKPGKDNVADAGDMPLFPAAKLRAHPVHNDSKRVSVAPEWKFDKQGQPEWFERFQKSAAGPERDFCYVHWMKLNEPQPVLVPSGLRLRVMFHTPYEDQWAPVLTDPLTAKRGELLEAGEVRFPKSLQAVVQVVDPQGKPVEGVAIRRLHEHTNAWSVAHNTDAKGNAFFFIHPHAKGKFRVSDLTGPQQITMAANLVKPFAVGDAPPDSTFRIEMSAEQLNLFRGK